MSSEPNRQAYPLLDVPLFAILIKPFASAFTPIWSAITRFRWMVARPLSIPLIPNFIPSCCGSTHLKSIPYISYGEVSLLLSFGFESLVHYRYKCALVHLNVF